jgi:hypothetical protein
VAAWGVLAIAFRPIPADVTRAAVATGAGMAVATFGPPSLIPDLASPALTSAAITTRQPGHLSPPELR